MPRRAQIGLPLLAILVISACERREGDFDRERSPDTHNVLLITLDTTRADRLGCYGYAAARTPALDALAKTGVRFEQVFCQVPLTLPSHVSLLTGTYPLTNGIRINGGGVLASDLPTLAEVFQAHGHRTGAFVGAWVLNSTFGLNRGFDRYDDQLGNDQPTGTLYKERPADQVCDDALAWLDERPAAPFFAWVHFFDPHHPYVPPMAFRAATADPYDGEIAFADSQVRRLLQWLEVNRCRERTLVVVTADHGEAFGEHGEIEHGLFVYGSTMHVPLILSLPDRLPQGKVVSATVRLVDVLPTILDLMGLAAVAGLPGESLRPALEADGFASLPAYGESEYPRAGFGWAPLRSYTTQQWKYIDAPRPELYNRSADPEEASNVIAEHADVASQLQAKLEALLARVPRRSAEQMALDDEAVRALQSLGYVGVSNMPDDYEDDEPRRDPKDMIHVFRGLSQAQRLLDQLRCNEVVELLEPLVEESPESDELHAALGEAYLELGRFEDAERAYRLSLRTVPNNPRKLCRLGDALSGQERIAEAAEYYEQAVSSSPNYGPAHNRLGMIRLRAGQYAQAAEHFRRHLELNPDSPRAMTSLAYALGEMGRHDEAVGLLQKALQRRPKLARAHRYLWSVLLAGGQRGEAIDALRAAREVLPDDLALTRHLARLLATSPQAEPEAKQEAVLLATQCCEGDPTSPESFDALALAHAAGGDFASAIDAARRALSLAEQQSKTNLKRQITVRLRAYQSGRMPNE